MRHGDVPEAMPGAGAVHHGGAMQLVGHGLQAGQHHDHGEGELLPDVDDDQRGQHAVDVVEEVDGLVGEAQLHGDGADDAQIAVVDPAPHIGGGDRADHIGDEKQAAQQPPAHELPVQRQRGAQAQDEGEERREHGPGYRVERHLVKAVAGQDPLVVREADEDLVGHGEAGRRVEEGKVDREVDRVADHQQHHAESRQDVEIVRPVASDLAQQARLAAGPPPHRDGLASFPSSARHRRLSLPVRPDRRRPPGSPRGSSTPP